MKLYESDVQMAAWDFVENKKIDVIEEGADIDKEVSYICPICQKKYKKKINGKENNVMFARAKKYFIICQANGSMDIILGKYFVIF